MHAHTCSMSFVSVLMYFRVVPLAAQPAQPVPYLTSHLEPSGEMKRVKLYSVVMFGVGGLRN